MSHVLAVLEQRDGALRKVSFETVTGARRLADALGGEVHALVIGAGPVGGTDAVGRFGADTVVTATGSGFARYAPEGCAAVVADRARSGGYGAVVVAATATGKDLAAIIGSAAAERKHWRDDRLSLVRSRRRRRGFAFAVGVEFFDCFRAGRC